MTNGWLRQEDARWIIRLSRELPELLCLEAQRQHALDVLCRKLGAQASAMALCSDFRPGGRGMMSDVADLWTGPDGDRLPLLSHYANGAAIDPAVVAMMNRALPANEVLTLRRVELVETRAWYRDPFVADTRRTFRLDDAMYSMKSVGQGRALGVCLNRAWGERPFSDTERNALELFHDTLTCLWERRPSLPEGIEASLSPREADTLKGILAGLSRKEIAARLKLQPDTVNDYAKTLFRKLGVHSRGELLARFVSQR